MGLAWSGGYGVQRKVAGSAQDLDRIQEVLAMGIMGIGGLVAVIGGILFLVVVGATLRSGGLLSTPKSFKLHILN